MLGRALDRIMRTVKRLQDHSSLLASSSASSACLLQKIICQFAAAIIAAFQRCIRIDDTDQCYVFKIKPLGNHLRSQQNIRTCGKIGKQTFMRSLASCRITVHTNHFCMRKTLFDIFLQTLCSSSQRAPVSAVAAWAGLRQYL